MKTHVNRRRFLAGAASAGAGLLILRDSSSAWSYQANEKLNVALKAILENGKYKEINDKYFPFSVY
jgi:ABC-type amino acid transport substrate-binding protein